jgi:hypothetical protein
VRPTSDGRRSRLRLKRTSLRRIAAKRLRRRSAPWARSGARHSCESESTPREPRELCRRLVHGGALPRGPGGGRRGGRDDEWTGARCRRVGAPGLTALGREAPPLRYASGLRARVPATPVPCGAEGAALEVASP